MTCVYNDSQKSPEPIDLATGQPRADVATLIIGCGNLLRGDDAAGPVLIRRMWERGLPPGIRCADGGTGGMDVAFQMRGVEHVILVDACQSGSEPGSLFEVPGQELENLPPLTGLNLHAFRWDHALAFGRWLLKDEYPQWITVYLIEGASFEIGQPLSPAVDRAVDALVDRLFRLLDPLTISIEIDDAGYLRISSRDAARFFPEDTVVPLRKKGRLYLLPTRGAAAGGMILKQRNLSGDRSLLVSEIFGFHPPSGRFVARWDQQLGGLEVQVPEGAGSSPEPHGSPSSKSFQVSSASADER